MPPARSRAEPAATSVSSKVRKLHHQRYTSCGGAANASTDTVIPSTIYYSKVGLELGRLVFKGQGMAPYVECNQLPTPATDVLPGPRFLTSKHMPSL
jgi:hypothetical protein